MLGFVAAKRPRNLTKGSKVSCITGKKKKKKFPGTRPISTTSILYRDQNLIKRPRFFLTPFSRKSDVIVKNKILSYIGPVLGCTVEIVFKGNLPPIFLGFYTLRFCFPMMTYMQNWKNFWFYIKIIIWGWNDVKGCWDL